MTRVTKVVKKSSCIMWPSNESRGRGSDDGGRTTRKESGR